MCRLTRCYEARCGRTTVAVGSQLSYCDYPANPPECTRPAKGPFIAGLTLGALSRLPGGPNMGAWPITQSPGAPRSPRSRCAKCGPTAMAPSRPRGTGGWVAPPEPEPGSWPTRRPGTSRGVVPPGEFSRRFRPVDVFAHVPALPGYRPAVLRAFNTHHKCTGVCRSVRGIPVGIRRRVAELWGFCGARRSP